MLICFTTQLTQDKRLDIFSLVISVPLSSVPPIPHIWECMKIFPEIFIIILISIQIAVCLLIILVYHAQVLYEIHMSNNLCGQKPENYSVDNA